MDVKSELKLTIAALTLLVESTQNLLFVCCISVQASEGKMNLQKINGEIFDLDK